MNNLIFAILALVMLSLPLFAKQEASTVQTVDSVDLDRYLGTWYQQAFFPARFQRADCGVVVTANYTLDDKGRIIVLNTCYGDEEETVIRRKAKAKAWPVDESNSKLKVQFFWPFKADYWIVKLDSENYRYSVVSDPSRKYLWILTREKVFPEQEYQEIVTWLGDNGWDTGKLVFTGKLK